MAKLSNRQRQIMSILLNHPQDQTAGSIAEEIVVSARTVHRELGDIQHILASLGMKLIKKSGIGIQIQGSEQQLERLSQMLFQHSSPEYSAEERRVLMLCLLLEHEDPVKLFYLASELQVATPTISSDLDFLEEEWIARYGLTLVRRRGYGVELQGEEAAKRRLIVELAIHFLDDSDLFGKHVEQPVHPLTKALLALVGKELFFETERALWTFEKTYPTALSEEMYTHLLIHLSVALTRIRKGRLIEGDSGTGAPADERLQLFKRILQLEVNERESDYLRKLLQWWEHADAQEWQFRQDMRLADLVHQLVEQVAAQATVKLPQPDRSLTEGLIHHLSSSLDRIREGIAIRNPLLAQIKKDFPELFQIVKLSVHRVLKGISVPDEEVGFLVMHFGAALERARQFSRTVRSLLVCTSGIGSSKLLAVRLAKELPQVELIDHVSWYEASRVPQDEYDLIISTVDLPLPIDQYIKLSPLLTPEETESLRAFIQNITLKRAPVRTEKKPRPSAINSLRQIKMYSDIMLKLIDRFEAHRLEEPDNASLHAVLTLICDRIKEGEQLGRTEPIIAQLIERERSGSQIIPDTELALFHTRSREVKQPFVSLFDLRRPLALREGPAYTKQILLMIAPTELPKASLEVLSELSAMLLFPELIELLRTGDAEEIKQWISRKFEEFLKTKAEWRE
ncbi:BglG family transcription antiterminator [Cohnella boryungensis]|uniref:BglG family transcription antiterminator n=1 Tax=Cohnella boryungensis TaxID=768479 RepID=A0ABV8SAK5_9BACL